MTRDNRRRQALTVMVCLFLGLVGSGCDPRPEPIEIDSLRISHADARFRISVAGWVIPGSVEVRLDGAPVELPQEARSLADYRSPFVLQLAPGSGMRALVVKVRRLQGLRVVTHRKSLNFQVPSDVPELISSWPAHGTRNLPRSEWIQLEFKALPPPETLSNITLTCSGVEIEFEPSLVGERLLILNPIGQLPASKPCLLEWPGRWGGKKLFFSTAREGEVAEVVYAPVEGRLGAPFPDDLHGRTARVGRRSGFRVALPDSEPRGPFQTIVHSLAPEVDGLDGFSPVGPIVVETSDSIDPASLPGSPAESLHPASSIILLDIDPRSPDYGHRYPFRAQLLDDPPGEGEASHGFAVFPSLPLRAGGRYGLIVTRALRVDETRPLMPSAFMQRVLEPPSIRDDPMLRRARRLTVPLLWLAEQQLVPPIHRDDVALAIRFSIRSLDGLADDLLHVRRQVFDEAPPVFTVDRVELDSSQDSSVAAVMHGFWTAPAWGNEERIERDESGAPRATGTREILFSLALPDSSAPGGAPIVIYRHGNPGNAEAEVVKEARRSLADAGFAVIGFTDVFNRKLSSLSDRDPAVMRQQSRIIGHLLLERRLPDYWLLTHFEQIAFLRLIEALRGLDVLPLHDPDGRPDLDLSRPLAYLGVSEGANHAPAFLAVAPEVRAAALVVGGAPISRVLAHQMQGTVLERFARELIGGRGIDLWIALSLFQAAVDRQDPFHFARHLHRDPIPMPEGPERASILLIGGVEDHRIPNDAMDALAWAIGPLPLLEPSPRDVPFLERVVGPVRANLGPETTGAYHQFTPEGIPGLAATPGCGRDALKNFLGRDGHFCAQVAEESVHLRRRFFESALDGGAPVIVDPLERSVD